MGGIEANLVSRGKKPVRCVCPWSDENTNHVDRRRSCISEMVYNVERKRADHVPARSRWLSTASRVALELANALGLSAAVDAPYRCAVLYRSRYKYNRKLLYRSKTKS